MVSTRHKHIDLSHMSPEELRVLIENVNKILEIRLFEEGLKKAVNEYRRRDPNVIHL